MKEFLVSCVIGLCIFVIVTIAKSNKGPSYLVTCTNGLQLESKNVRVTAGLVTITLDNKNELILVNESCIIGVKND